MYGFELLNEHERKKAERWRLFDMDRSAAKEIRDRVIEVFGPLHRILKEGACVRKGTTIQQVSSVYPNIKKLDPMMEKLIKEYISQVSGELMAASDKFYEWLNKRVSDGIISESDRFDAALYAVMVEVENHSAR
jgi:molybdopterin converting factor small subunit